MPREDEREGIGVGDGGGREGGGSEMERRRVKGDGEDGAGEAWGNVQMIDVKIEQQRH